MTDIAISAAGETNPGQLREKNEDNLFVTRPDANVPPSQIAARGYLYVVADGVGGNRGGARAAEMTVNGIPTAYYAGDSPDPAQNLRTAFDTTARQILDDAASNPDRSNMSCTVVAAAVVGNQATIAHLGDARAYLLRGGQLQRLTSDHTWVQEQVDKGTLSVAEADTHPDRNVITKSMGGASMPAPTMRQVTLQPGDRLLLCSDGLCGVANDAEMQAVLNSAKTPGAAVAKLIALANQKGGPDNITALVTQVGQPVAAARRGAPVLPLLLAGLAVVMVGGWLAFAMPGNGPVANGSTPQATAAPPTEGAPVVEDANATSPTSTAVVAVSETVTPTATITPTVVAAPVTPVEAQTLPLPPIAILEMTSCEPGSIARFQSNETIPFRWSWGGQLPPGAWLELRAGQARLASLRQFQESSLPTSGEWNHQIAANGFGEGLGLYQWQVVIVPAGGGTPLVNSPRGCFVIEASGDDGGGDGGSGQERPTATYTAVPVATTPAAAATTPAPVATTPVPLVTATLSEPITSTPSVPEP